MLRTQLSFFVCFFFASNQMFSAQNTYLATDYNILPSNSGIENVKNFDSLLQIIQKDKQGHIKIPKGNYHFRFSKEYPSLLISKACSITIEGEGYDTKLIMDNENPQSAWSLFEISSVYTESVINFYLKNIQLVGVSNAGYLKEKNLATNAISLSNGNANVYVTNCKVSGNFFNGISGTGNGTQLIEIDSCEIENYGAKGAGLFGTGNVKTLHVFNTTFLRSGLAPTETTSGQDYGTGIYCHPNVNVKVVRCKFYNNYRNAIQFASGTAIYNKKFPADSFHVTAYQIFEHNYFDPTCADGIQLGFFYPKAIIRYNHFNNSLMAIQGINSALIEHNFFGNKVNRAIEYGNFPNKMNEDSIEIIIRHNQFHGNVSLFVQNPVVGKKGFKTIIHSYNNVYHGGIILGNALVGDTESIHYYSDKDTMHTSVHSFLAVDYNTHSVIKNCVVSGIRFLAIGLHANGATALVEHLTCVDETNSTQLVYQPLESDARKAHIELRNAYAIDQSQSTWIVHKENDVQYYFRKAQCKDTLVASETIGDKIQHNYDTYCIKGADAINQILLFKNADASNPYSWQRTLAGTLTLKSMTGFSLSTSGNIDIDKPIIVPKGKNIILKFDREKEKWVVVR